MSHYKNQGGRKDVHLPHKAVLFSTGSYYSLRKHIGNCQKDRQAEVCVNFASSGVAVENRQGPHDVTSAEIQVVLEEGPTRGLCKTTIQGVVQV